MLDHPSPFGGETGSTGSHAWNDRAALHGRAGAGGLFDGATAIRRGTFADMIRYLAMLPEAERDNYVIEKAGDREYSASEAMALASHPDFPAQGSD